MPHPAAGTISVKAAIGAFAALAATVLATATVDAQQFETQPAGGRWFKGNTHTHTINTDGDSPPDTVVSWYRSRGYNFLVVSDHDTITDPATLGRHVDPNFILVPGEEVTGRFQRAPVHLTALNLKRIVKPGTAATLLETLQTNVIGIRAAGGVPLINHPNFRWALNLETLANVKGVALFELYNGHPQVHNEGGGNAPSTEALWDALLSSGKRIYGVASDDAHHWKQWGKEHVNPGRGWIFVRAARLNADALVQALEAGQFYSSTGVELADIVVTPQAIEVRIKPDRDFRYHTEFIGNGGNVLARSDSLVSRYRLQAGITYVRARVTDSGGRRAWTQPVHVR
jgi:hypothetical protein